MSTFDHPGLIRDINESLAPFRKGQPEAMAGFGQLARASMAEGAISTKHKELIALAIGVTQRCSGCIGFHVKALRKLDCTRAELEERRARQADHAVGWRRCSRSVSTGAVGRRSCTRPRR